MDPNYQYTQAIILLSDGLNTQDRWYSNASSIDARQQKTCDNIKAAGITIYTVQVNTGGDPTSTLLQNCASDTSKFFLLTSATQIVTTFNQIGTALSNLRLANDSRDATAGGVPATLGPRAGSVWPAAARPAKSSQFHWRFIRISPESLRAPRFTAGRVCGIICYRFTGVFTLAI